MAMRPTNRWPAPLWVRAGVRVWVGAGVSAGVSVQVPLIRAALVGSWRAGRGGFAALVLALCALAPVQNASAQTGGDAAQKLGADTAVKAVDPLYVDLGELPGITRITQDLLIRVHADPRTRDYFADASEKRLREKLIEQLCQVAGGPCAYTGRSMERAHEGLHITRAAFNALVEDLQEAMDQNDIPFRVQNRLLARLAPMVHQIEDR